MNRIIALALLVGGIILLIIGYNAYHSAGSGLSRAFTGSPTDKTMWLLIGGGVATAVGLFGVMRGSKQG